MPKISIKLPNVTEISMEATDASEMRQVVDLFKSALLDELARISPNGTQQKDVVDQTSEGISVPANGANRAREDDRDDPPVVPPVVSEPPEAPLAAEEPPFEESPTPTPSARRASPPAGESNATIPSQLSDPRLGHDFAVFCRTVNPIGDMRKVVVAAEGADRVFSMANVDEWELGHLFSIAGWPPPHSFTQSLRNAARSKFRWLERAPGRAGRYSVTEAGREVVLKGTNLL